MLDDVGVKTINEWELKHNPDGKLAEEAQLAARLNAFYGSRAVEFIAAFGMMNKIDQDRIMEIMEKLKQNPENRKEQDE